MAKLIAVGHPAPDFTLPDQNGDRVTLSDLWKQGPVVIYFYPKDETPGCTKEACAFRDTYETFTSHGARVVGISADTVESHRRFVERHHLPFTLVADETREVRSRYGVPKTLGLLDGRVTFVIDRQGIVRHVFSSQLFAAKHVGEALEILKTLPRL